VSNLGGTSLSQIVMVRVGSGFLTPGIAGDVFHLTMTDHAGGNYLIETSADLRSWLALATIMNTESSWSFSELIEPGVSVRFYRVQRIP
jgi:hypothetical protein